MPAAGVREPAWEIMTTTGGRICTLLITGRIGSITTSTEYSGRLAKRLVRRDRERLGAQAARLWTTTATDCWIWSSRTMWISIYLPHLRPARGSHACGRVFRLFAVLVDWR